MIEEMSHDDVDLRDLEDDAFLPGQNGAPRKRYSESIATRWIPPRLRAFFENLSRIKVRLLRLRFELILIGHVKSS